MEIDHAINTTACKIKELIDMKRLREKESVHRQTLNNTEIKDYSSYTTLSNQEDNIKNMLNSNTEKVSPHKSVNKVPLTVKIQELKDDKRRLNLKVTVLENKVRKLESCLTEFAVIFI